MGKCIYFLKLFIEASIYIVISLIDTVSNYVFFAIITICNTIYFFFITSELLSYNYNILIYF